jgi:glycosyltransferase involved in cell wall biosynthesis
MTARKPLRIMHVVETLDNGGAERILASIVNNLPADEFLSFVCCVKNTGVVADSLRNLGGPVTQLKRYEGSSYYTGYLLAKALRDNHIDIVHGHNWSTFCETVIGGVLARTERIVNTIHGLQDPPSAGPVQQGKRMMRTVAERGLSRLSGQICSVSKMVKENVLRATGLDEEKVSVIYNGIEVDAGNGGPKSPTDPTAPRDPEFVLSWAGRIVPVKNLPCLLESIALAKDRVENLVLNIIGDGPERETLKKEAKTLGIERQVRFVGYSSDVRRWLSLSDVFVLPSHYEGFSVALLEAMAAGLPVIATSVGGNPEIVIPGETGVLVPPGDSKALAEAIFDLHRRDDLRTDMGKRGAERVRQEFNLKKMMSEYIKVYREEA